MWHWDRLFSEYCCFPLSLPFIPPMLHTHSATHCSAVTRSPTRNTWTSTSTSGITNTKRVALRLSNQCERNFGTKCYRPFTHSCRTETLFTVTTAIHSCHQMSINKHFRVMIQKKTPQSVLIIRCLLTSTSG